MTTVEFFKLIPDGISPMRAPRAADGSIPTRGFRFCEALTTASSIGWYLFPPISLRFVWDGRKSISWSFDNQAEWFPLTRGAQFPSFAKTFNSAAPEEIRGYSPPFVSATEHPGLIQVWTGLIARTAPDWSLLLRSPPNIVPSGDYFVYDGLIETDCWFGPLFTNIRLTATDRPVVLSHDAPLLLAQPIPRSAYADATLNKFTLRHGLESLNTEDWADYDRTIVVPSKDAARTTGHYAIQVRQRRSRELKLACPRNAHTNSETLG